MLGSEKLTTAKRLYPSSSKTHDNPLFPQGLGCWCSPFSDPTAEASADGPGWTGGQ